MCLAARNSVACPLHAPSLLEQRSCVRLANRDRRVNGCMLNSTNCILSKTHSLSCSESLGPASSGVVMPRGKPNSKAALIIVNITKIVLSQTPMGCWQRGVPH
jgi:hypothetical protein